MRKLLSVVIVLPLVLALGACHTKDGPFFHASNVDKITGPVKNAAKQTVAKSKEYARHVANDVRNAPGAANRRIHFPFDSARLSPDDINLIGAHVRYLQNHPRLTVYVEGHTDQRGSHQYNYKLAERRASAIKDEMVKQGLQAERIVVLSAGKDKPIRHGQNQIHWQKNRRAYIHYG